MAKGMEEKLYSKLIESASQAVEIVRGERKPSRTFVMTSDIVREIRESTGLSQARFANLFHISVGTLRNWEQGRRRPDGPAVALLIAIRNDPEHVVAALNTSV
jgi:putative transcriptional regulator